MPKLLKLLGFGRKRVRVAEESLYSPKLRCAADGCERYERETVLTTGGKDVQACVTARKESVRRSVEACGAAR